MPKIKIFHKESGFASSADIEEAVNDFLEKKKINRQQLIDIKFIGNNENLCVMVIYNA